MISLDDLLPSPMRGFSFCPSSKKRGIRTQIAHFFQTRLETGACEIIAPFVSDE